METLNGYKMISTFPLDFTIADKFGEDAIRDTFNRAFRECKSNYVYLTELVVSLNCGRFGSITKTTKKTLRKFTMNFGKKRTIMLAKTLKVKDLGFFYRVTD